MIVVKQSAGGAGGGEVEYAPRPLGGGGRRVEDRGEEDRQEDGSRRKVVGWEVGGMNIVCLGKKIRAESKKVPPVPKQGHDSLHSGFFYLSEGPKILKDKISFCAGLVRGLKT